MNFPAKLSRLCWQKGWSQRELAEALGDVSKSTVSNWMTGKSDPRLQELARMAAIFKVSVDYLVLDEREEPGGDGLSEPQRRVLWAAETVGFEVALKRIMKAPISEEEASMPRPAAKAADVEAGTPPARPKRARPGGRGTRAKRSKKRSAT